MRSFKNANYYHPFLILIFFSLIALALVAPISSDKYIPNLADYINHLAAIIQAKSALAEGQFPLRIAPLEQFGFRYPYYQFYSSTTFTIAGLIYKYLIYNPLVVYKCMLWLGLVAAGFYMYKLAYWFVKSEVAAILSSIVYLTTPYYIITVNHLGNINETLALGIIPAVVYYSYRRYFCPNNKTLIQMSLSWYLLITVHIVSFIYTSFFVGLLLVLITFRQKKRFKNLMSVGIGYLFSLLLSMWFLAPIMDLSHYFMLSSTFSNAEHFMRYSPLISNLLFPGLGMTKGYKTIGLTVHPAIGWPMLMGAAIALYALFNRNNSVNKRADYLMPVILLLFLITFAMVWSPFNFWKWIPDILLVGQYSWRILNQLIWLGALLFAWSIVWIFKNQLDRRHLIVGLLVIVMTTNVWFPRAHNANFTLKKFTQKPLFIYNQNAYTINFNENTKFVDMIDTMILYSLVTDSTLNLNKIYYLPRALLDIAYKPEILFEGSRIPANIAKNNLTLDASLNGNLLSQANLKAGPFNWHFPLPYVKDKNAKKPYVNLVFQLQKNDKASLKIPVKGILLSGLLDKQKLINVNTTKKTCQQKGTATLCNIFVPNNKELLELPIIYYPNLLTIDINGKKVPYQSVLYFNNLITVVKPIPGIVNQIKFEFTGEKWANWTSLLSWFLWLILLTGLIIRKYFFNTPVH